MKKIPILLRYAALCLLFPGLLAAVLGSARRVTAQNSGLSVRIGRPAEGETFYSGADSLLYTIPINGWAFSENFAETELTVQLEVIQAHEVLSTQTTIPEPDGSFRFAAEVNPGNTVESFTIAFQGCADKCHYSTDMVLPAGELLLRATAADPSGAQAVDERRITVDRSSTIDVPVRLVLEGGPEYGLAGIQISAATQLYQWRKRGSLGMASPNGQATLQLEALAQAPTTYHLKVEPQVVDGVLFSGKAAAELTLLPGETDLAEVVLPVQARLGRIAGQLSLPGGVFNEPVPVWAFHLPEGQGRQVETDLGGQFTFEPVAIGRYLLIPDPQALMAQGAAAHSTWLDLSANPETTADLAAQSVSGRQLQGMVRGVDGAPLPFAWVETARQSCSAAVEPADGRFSLSGLPDLQGTTLVASAPGYYSQAQAIEPEADLPLVFDLVRRPETSSLTWGSGAIQIPPESLTAWEDGVLTLDSGWLWGNGGGETIVIRVNEITLQLSQGSFALEKQAGGEAWLYLLRGQAELVAGGGAPVQVQAGEMVRLAPGSGLIPVAYQPALLYGLREDQASIPLAPTWQPGLGAILRDRLAQLGLSTAQGLVLAVYLLAAAALLAGPLLLIVALLRRLKNR
jgi:hypothetical protein